MSDSSINPHPELAQLLVAIYAFQRGEMHIQDLQRVIWSTAEALTSFGDRQLRRQLESAESQLELIRFTSDSDKVRISSLTFVAELEKLLLSHSTSD